MLQSQFGAGSVAAHRLSNIPFCFFENLFKSKLNNKIKVLINDGIFMSFVSVHGINRIMAEKESIIRN